MGDQSARNKSQDMPVDAYVDSSLDPSSSLGASTILTETRFLSNENLAGHTGGVFVVLGVKFVLNGDVFTASITSTLWTRLPSKHTHQEPFFSLTGVFLFLLWTFAFKSKGHFTLSFVRVRDYFAFWRLE